MLTSFDIKRHAQALGFDLTGVAPAELFPELARLDEWLARGHAGEMRYLHTSAQTRRDIRNFLPTARSVVVTGTVYYTESADDPAEAGPHERGSGPRARIARYAWGDDYHTVLAERLERLVVWMRERSEEAFDARIFVDKHHVQERVFAKYAGLGWIGKNTCLINPALGSWIYLAGVAVSLRLDVDAPGTDLCGACTICVDACPTGALVNDGDIDARRCISYLTIEHRGPIPTDARAALGDHVFGCDICQEVCPYNLAPLATLDNAWQPRPGRADARAADLWQMSDLDLHQIVDGSAMVRAPLSRLRRNLAVVLGNGGDPRSAEVLDRPGGGVPHAALSADTPLVQTHVEWAKRALTELDHAPSPPTS